MYVSYYVLILGLHERKHKSSWPALHAEVVSGTETKGLLSALARLTQECEKAHSRAQNSAGCQKYFCFNLLLKEKKPTFFFCFALFCFLHLPCLIFSPNNLSLSWPVTGGLSRAGSGSTKNVMK